MNSPRFRQPTQRRSLLEKRFNAWVHSNCTCCLTGYPEFQIAHTGGMAQGKGLSGKSAINTCLPIRHELHLAEEKSRASFWHNVGFPDHLAWAERLYDLFETGENPTALLMDMQDRANRDFIASILMAHR